MSKTTQTSKNTATIKTLNELLAAFLDLALATKQAHWTLKGPSFIAVHEMLDTFNGGLLAHADEIAERAAQLGGVPLGTAQSIVKATALKAYPLNLTAAADHVAQLLARYGALAGTLGKIINGNAADAGTIDILTGAANDLEKYAWFLRSHLA